MHLKHPNMSDISITHNAMSIQDSPSTLIESVETSSQSFQDHSVSELPLVYKPFKCNMCPYSCKTRSRMKLHKQYVHSNIRPYKCMDCPYSSKNKRDWQRHVIRIHPSNMQQIPEISKPTAESKSRDELHQCQYCTFTTNLKCNLTRHKYWVHAMDNLPTPVSNPEMIEGEKDIQAVTEDPLEIDDITADLVTNQDGPSIPPRPQYATM